MMKRIGSFLVFLILIFFDISTSFSNDYMIKKVEIAGNNRISTSYITNITNKYLNKKITDEEINIITKIKIDSVKSTSLKTLKSYPHQHSLSPFVLLTNLLLHF